MKKQKIDNRPRILMGISRNPLSFFRRVIPSDFSVRGVLFTITFKECL